MFEELVKETLGGVSTDVEKQLLNEIEHVGASLILHDVSNVVAHNLLKAIDGIVAAAVKVADSDTAQRLAHAYSEHLDKAWIDLIAAVQEYIPLQVGVEHAKHLHGDHSPEANTARHLRQHGIETVKQDVSAVFGDLIGKYLKLP